MSLQDKRLPGAMMSPPTAIPDSVWEELMAMKPDPEIPTVKKRGATDIYYERMALSMFCPKIEKK